MEEQYDLACKCLEQYVLPPNISNLNLHYGAVGTQISNYFKEKDSWPTKNSDEKQSNPDPSALISPTLPPKQLCEKLRWVTLGYQYDWTARTYPKESIPFPSDLAQFIKKQAASVGIELCPEAAIINYYAIDSTLGGHLDDAEFTFEVPIISIRFEIYYYLCEDFFSNFFSLGNTGIFLLGGTTKDVKPIAIFLRSGDVMIMGGKSRLCYHGIPRIIASSIPSYLISSERASQRLADFLKTARINLNVRQVNPNGKPTT